MSKKLFLLLFTFLFLTNSIFSQDDGDDDNDEFPNQDSDSDNDSDEVILSEFKENLKNYLIERNIYDNEKVMIDPVHMRQILIDQFTEGEDETPEELRASLNHLADRFIDDIFTKKGKNKIKGSEVFELFDIEEIVKTYQSFGRMDDDDDNDADIPQNGTDDNSDDDDDANDDSDNGSDDDDDDDNSGNGDDDDADNGSDDDDGADDNSGDDDSDDLDPDM